MPRLSAAKISTGRNPALFATRRHGKGDAPSRANHFFESGRVFLPEKAPWLRDYVAELTSFPASKYDDQVDSTTQFLDVMRQPGVVVPIVGPISIEKESYWRM